MQFSVLLVCKTSGSNHNASLRSINSRRRPAETSGDGVSFGAFGCCPPNSYPRRSNGMQPRRGIPANCDLHGVRNSARNSDELRLASEKRDAHDRCHEYH